MKIKRKLYWDLILRYLIFLISAVVATGLFLGGVVFVSMTTLSKYPEAVENLNVYFNNIEYDDRTKELKLPTELEEGSWVEILKDNKVVFVEGKKQDDKMEYTQEELALIANNTDELKSTSKYIYEYVPFTGKDEEKYIFLYKKPKVRRGGFKMGLNLPAPLQGSDFEREINTKLGIILGGFVLSIITIILLFSRLTTKKLIKPLNELNKGFKSIMNGEYGTRLDFKGSYEFEEIRDAFNYMSQRLETVEREKKEIAESKKRLLLDISHDLRTPATTIQGYAEALQNDVVINEEDKKKYLSYIYEKSKLVTNLIERLFKYSKLESRVFDLNREVKDVSEFLRNIIIGFYGELDSKEFELDIEIPDEKIMFDFDEIELERALSNIIGNIIKYNPNKTALIVSLEEKDNNIQIMIGDNGIGISEHVRKNIFNPLVRGDNVRKTDGGTGLGLAISKKIIELHGGHIKLESELGKGSKFFINLKRISNNM